MGINDTMGFEKVGIKVPDVLLPTKGFETWAVVACDQYTSQKEVWLEMERIVGDRPSTLKLMLPEAYLDEADVNERNAQINAQHARVSGNRCFRAASAIDDTGGARDDIGYKARGL